MRHDAGCGCQSGACGCGACRARQARAAGGARPGRTGQARASTALVRRARANLGGPPPVPSLPLARSGTARIHRWVDTLDAMDELEADGDAFVGSMFSFGLMVPDLVRTVRALRDSWREGKARYGCYCGKGSCDGQHAARAVDGLDACCRAHDLAYDRVGVGTAGGVDMWTPAGITRTANADLQLVGCANRARSVRTPNDPVVNLIVTMFGGRATVARLLMHPRVPACVRSESRISVLHLHRIVGC